MPSCLHPLSASLLLFGGMVYNSSAQYGQIDYSFDGDGMAAYSSASQWDAATCMSIQPDGKILLGGVTSANFLLLRCLADGSPDNSFGSMGKVQTGFSVPYSSNQGNAITLQPDGKILLAGSCMINDGSDISCYYAISRYNTDGSLDTSFDHDGKILTAFSESIYSEIYAIGIQPDGKIVAAGSTGYSCVEPQRMSAARYLPNGQPDSSFGTDGRVVLSPPVSRANTLIIQPDGKILLGGYLNGSGAAIRLNANGSIDPSFNITPSGNYLNCMGHDSSGKIIAAGGKSDSLNMRAYLTRFETDGTTDTDFESSITGSGLSEVFHAMVIEPSGKIITVGYSGDGLTSFILLARFNPDGSRDNTFGTGGITISSFQGNEIANACAIHPNGKLMLAGLTGTHSSAPDPALFRYHTHTVGIMENYHGISINVYPNPTPDHLNIELNSSEKSKLRLLNADGKLLFETTCTGLQQQINLSAFTAGLMVLEIEQTGSVYRNCIIKQ